MAYLFTHRLVYPKSSEPFDSSFNIVNRINWQLSPNPPKFLRVAGITVHDKELEIQWSDGHASIYPHKFLRQKCRCALCAGEPFLSTGGLMMPNVNLPNVPDNVAPTRFGQVGNYGLSINWSDGHNTGIYSFNYLREICQCEICTAKG